uniref:Uncharacterized protein n=1 Tax=Avena sativa TaxID=4498 RepID=A0ACD5YWJ3_AVESA
MGKSSVKATRRICVAKFGEDRLSKLPDDILLTIVERLNIADAARTSIYSRRWKQIPAMLSKVVITVDPFERLCQRSNKKVPYYDAAQLNSTMIEATRSILGSRSANLYTIQLLRIKFYLGDDSIFIGQTVADTMATQNVGFADFAIMTRKCGRLCTDEELLNYGRQLVSLVYTCPSAFSGLTSLKLQNLRLGESEFPKIFGISRRLEFLSLEYCDMGMLSFLELERPQLSELVIVDCHFEMVDLKWLPKLTLLTFSGWISLYDPLSFGHVPLLQSVNITNIGLSWHKMLKLSDFLGQATINDLHLNFKCEKIWIVPEGPRELWQVFHKLQIVELINISEDCDLSWIMFILQGAPYLKELCIRVWDHLCEVVRDEKERKEYAFSEKKDKGLEWDTSSSNFSHHSLAVLRIFGFQTEVKFMSLIGNVMDVAVSLKKIYLYNKPVCKTCQHVVRKPSRYPGSWKQKNSLRNKIIEGMCSDVEVYFPHKITC